MGSAYTDCPPGTITATTGQVAVLTAPASGEAVILCLRDGRTSAATTVAIERMTLSRATGSAPTGGTAQTPGLANTRSRAASLTMMTTPTAGPTVDAAPLIVIGSMEKHERCFTWHPPRPWASPYLVNGELLVYSDSNASASDVAHLIHTEEPVRASDRRRIHRRPRRGMLYHYHSESTNYCHSASAPAYDIQRRVYNNWVCRLPVTADFGGGITQATSSAHTDNETGSLTPAGLTQRFITRSLPRN